MGKHLMRLLVNEGHAVVGVDDLSGAFKPSSKWSPHYQNPLDEHTPHYIVQDLRVRVQPRFNTAYTEPCVANIIHKFQPEVIYHLAANAREGASQFQPVEVMERNVQAYLNVLEPAIATRALQRMVLFSSMAVYGDQTPPFTEDMSMKPVDVYAVCKASMEEITKILADVHGFEWVIVRPHNVYGPGQTLKDKFRNVAAIFMNRIMRGEPVTVYGDGEQQRAFSFIEDSLPAYARAGFEPKAAGKIINIGGKNPCTVNHMLGTVFFAMGQRGFDAVPVENVPDRPHEVKFAWSDWRLSEKILGYEEHVNLEQGIERMAEWAARQGAQEWTPEILPLFNEKMPKSWLSDAQKAELEAGRDRAEAVPA
jgi:UDP-glucose 4-epimerase